MTERTKARRNELEQRARVALDRLLDARGGASIETARTLLGPASRRGLPTEQRSAANARTRQYKARQALARAPESEDVVTACGYVVLGILEYTAGQADSPLRVRLLDTLRQAGFDDGESAAAIERLTLDVEDRRQGWHRRLERRSMQRLIAVLR
jgi:ribosomal protein S18 acetylase RimI-like enzyme